MYHIKPDKRSQNSAKTICEALANRLNHKKFEDISISEICAHCGIARTTFYRLFDTIDDILIYQFDSLFKEAIQKSIPQESSYAKLILQLVMENQTLTSMLIKSQRTDLFDFSTRLHEDTLIQNLNLNMDTKKQTYCTAMLNAIVYAAIKTWIDEGKKISPDELYAILKSNIQFIGQHV